MKRRILLSALSFVLGYTSLAHSDAPKTERISFSLSVSENGGALSAVKLASSGGKLDLPRGAWKCEYGTPDFTSVEGGRKKGSLDVKCAMGAAVIRISTTCIYTAGPGKSASDVAHDAQGVTLTVPNGKYTAYLALGCDVK